MALICNYITTWTIHNFKSNVNIKSNVNVCDDLSIAFVCIPIQQCNKPYQMLVTPGRGRQRWPAMAICKIQPYGSAVFEESRWSSRQSSGQFCTQQIADNFGNIKADNSGNNTEAMTRQSTDEPSNGITTAAIYFECMKGWYEVFPEGLVHLLT